jgi:cell division protein FtsQ
MLTTFQNKKINDLNFLNINKIEILGISNTEKNQFQTRLEYLYDQNIFKIKKNEILDLLSTEKILESINIKKNYPTKLIANFKKTEFIAITKVNNLDYYIGSNKNLILTSNKKTKLPRINDSTNYSDLLKLKKIIDQSNLNFGSIEEITYFKSGRYDLLMANGLIIKLPINNLESSIKFLEKIIFRNEFNNLKIIDLRLKNQLIVYD